MAALSALVTNVIDKIFWPNVVSSALTNNVEAEVKKWNDFLNGLKTVLDDAEERRMTEGPIKIRLDDLRDLAFDVENILDEFSTEVLRQQVMQENEASSSTVRKFFHYIFSRPSPRNPMLDASLMNEITQRFEKITQKKEDFRLTERDTGGSSGVVRERSGTTCLVQKFQVYGREKDEKTIKGLLSRPPNGMPFSLVAVVGMGGVGKTTLAQLVYNDKTFNKSFHIMAWVCVSDDFNVLNITLQIIEGFTGRPCNSKDLNIVQLELKKAVNGKTFLLILDDVWNEEYMKWNALIQPLAAGGLGSKVLITTRNKQVALTAGTDAVLMHPLEKLEAKECLSLLALHAFEVDNFSGHQSLQEIGEQIAKKCDGLPLAAKALGGLLRGKSNPREWRIVLDSNMWELPQDKCPILPALRLSYHYLPSHLKQCFGYCAIFPKDYEFEKDDLILWWMAQGFLEQSNSNFMEVGKGYFNDLLSRSFFQPSPRDDGSRFVMHDLINDLAIWISEGICLHVSRFRESKDDIKFENLRHLSFLPYNHKVEQRIEKISSSMKLRSFVMLQCSTSFTMTNSFLDKVITNMKYLKLLRFNFLLKDMPHSIFELKQLRHLDMSYTWIRLLPKSISNLLNLQVLNLNDCCALSHLPIEIGKLINLRILDISKTPSLKLMPSEIVHLKNLQILTKFIVGENHELRLRELKRFSLIRGELSIWGLEKVVDIQEAKYVNLKAKEGLVTLEFKWMEKTSALEKEKQVQILDELQPNSSLKNLEISGYNGICFSKWIGDSSLTNLERLCLLDCGSASLLPPLGGLMSLKMLKISNMHEVKNVGKEFLGSVENSFPSLETLILGSMNALEKWCSGLEFGEEARVQFPRLKNLYISDCPKLVGLPNHLPLLGELSIRGFSNLTNLECTLHSLRKLMVECSESTLKNLTNLYSLEKLELKNIRGLNYMDDGFVSMLGELQELDIYECRELKTLVRNGKGIERMVGLKTLKITNCDELEALVAACETKLNYFPSLESLEIGECNKLVSFGAMSLPSSLKRMDIWICAALKSLPEGIMIDGSSTIEPALEKLSIMDCPSLTTLPRRFLDQLVLSGRGCENLELLDRQDLLRGLKSLKITKCEKVIESLLDGRLSLPSLTNLEIDGAGVNIKQEAPVILPNLHTFTIWNFGNLESLAAAFQLPSSIKEIYIDECPRLRELPIHELPPNLERVSIYKCPLLKKRCVDRKGEYWPILSIIPDFEIDRENFSSIGDSS